MTRIFTAKETGLKHPFVPVKYGPPVKLSPDEVIVVDFETYYDKEFSLRKMNTVEYIRDPRFKIHCAGVKVGREPAKCLFDDELDDFLRNTDWSKYAFAAHNAAFDGLIATEYYGLRPKYWIDTLTLARACLHSFRNHSLEYVSNRLGLGAKIKGALESVAGIRDLSPEDRERIAPYAIQDAELCHQILFKLIDKFPESEFKLLHLTTRFFTEPVLLLNTELLDDAVVKDQAEEDEKLRAAGDIDKALLSSNQKFAQLLIDHGVELPVKVSKTTNKVIPALGIKDPGFISLRKQYADNPTISAILDARVKVKHTITRTRAEKMSKIGANNQTFPIKLNYYGAHTGRWSGGGGLNPQNLPRGGVHRRSIEAPPGYMIVSIDASQIEARITAWMAQEQKLLDGFARMSADSDTDVYTDFASKVFGRPITKANKLERFVGKTCILGLGFGMGAQRLKETLYSGTPSIDYSVVECKRLVHTYRNEFSSIPMLWSILTSVALDMLYCETGRFMCLHYLGRQESNEIDGQKETWVDGHIYFPSGMKLLYPHMTYNASTSSHSYRDPRTGYDVHLWGGLLLENCVQGIARCVTAECILAIDERYRVVTSTHDECVFIAPENEAEEALTFGLEVFSKTPHYLPGLVLAAEGSYNRCYTKA